MLQVLFFSGDSPVDIAIRAVTRPDGQVFGTYSHVGIAVDLAFFEAVPPVVREGAIRKDYALALTLPCSPEQQARALAFLRSQVGQPYDTVEDIFLGVDILAHLELADTHGDICSQLAALALFTAGIQLPHDPRMQSPQSLHDDLVAWLAQQPAA